MDKNSLASQKHQKYDKSNLEYRGNTSIKISKILNYPLSCIGKEVKHMRAFLIHDLCQSNS